MRKVCYGSCFTFGEDNKLAREQLLSEPVKALLSGWTDLHVYSEFSYEESHFRQCIITQNSGFQKDIIVTELHKLAIKIHLLTTIKHALVFLLSSTMVVSVRHWKF